jgi:hypothetical protein
MARIPPKSRHVPLRSRDHPLNDIVTRNVRVYMEWNRISRTDLAHALDCDGSTVSRALSGQRHWSVPDLGQLAEMFDVPPQLLLDDTVVRNRCFRLGSLIAA